MKQAFSRLKQVLERRCWTLGEIRRRLLREGVSASERRLQRLCDDSRPLERLDLRLAAALCATCRVPLSDLIEFRTTRLKLRQLAAPKQRRLDELMSGNSLGQLNATERNELEQLVREAEALTLRNGRLLDSRRGEAMAR